METVAFHSYRGGVGKTLLSVNTAINLVCQHEKKVCLVDFDLRAPSHQSYFNSSEEITIAPGSKMLTDFLIGNTTPNKVVTPTNLKKFFCVFSNIEILQKKSTNRTKLTQHGEGRILAKLFDFLRYCENHSFDFVVIDCMPGLTYRSLDALVVSDKIMVVTRPVKSEVTGLNLVISECYSKLEGAKFFSVMNQIERKEDLAHPPNSLDEQIANSNYREIEACFQNEVSIPLLHSFRRVPFVTERIYVLEEIDHPFSKEIREFTIRLLSAESEGNK